MISICFTCNLTLPVLLSNTLEKHFKGKEQQFVGNVSFVNLCESRYNQPVKSSA